MPFNDAITGNDAANTLGGLGGNDIYTVAQSGDVVDESLADPETPAAAKAKVAGSSTIRNATVGALTCVLHDAGRAQAQKMLPTVALGEYLSEVIGPWQGIQSYSPTGLSEYLSGTDAIGASDYVSAGGGVVY